MTTHTNAYGRTPSPSNNLDRAIAQATQLVSVDNEAALLNILAALRIVSEELTYLARRAK